jgi:NAD-dependent DNA ligase
MVDRIKELEWIIQYNAHRYYCLNNVELDDWTYDEYWRELKKLDPTNPILQRVGESICEELHETSRFE